MAKNNAKNSKGNPICGAKNRRGEICQHPAGWGCPDKTKGNGRCKLHGGMSSGAPKGNKNSVTHGYYETIIVDKLMQDEKDFFNNHDIDKIKQLDNEIKLAIVREGRMLERINEINAKIGMIDLLNDSNMNSQQHWAKVNRLEDQRTSAEEKLTVLQTSIAKMLELKHKLEGDLGVDDDKAEENRKHFLEKIAPQDDIFGGDDDES